MKYFLEKGAIERGLGSCSGRGPRFSPQHSHRCHTTVCHSKARGSDALFYIISHQAHMWYIDTCSGKMPIYVE